jgi:hypothetical protein
MVKRRSPKASGLNIIRSEPTPEQIEAFAAGAEGNPTKTEQPKTHEPDPDANRDFKAIRVPFNEYEYEQLVKGAKLSGRTKLNFMRYAMLKLARELQEEEQK